MTKMTEPWITLEAARREVVAWDARILDALEHCADCLRRGETPTQIASELDLIQTMRAHRGETIRIFELHDGTEAMIYGRMPEGRRRGPRER